MKKENLILLIIAAATLIGSCIAKQHETQSSPYPRSFEKAMRQLGYDYTDWNCELVWHLSNADSDKRQLISVTEDHTREGIKPYYSVTFCENDTIEYAFDFLTQKEFIVFLNSLTEPTGQGETYTNAY